MIILFKKRSLIVFMNKIVLKNDCYSFSKSSKRVGRFFRKRNDSFWKRLENETINDRFQKRLTTLHYSFYFI